MRESSRRHPRPLTLLAGLVLLYLALPFVAFLWKGPAPSAFPAGLLPAAALTSVLSATLAVVLDLAFGVPLGYLLARKRLPQVLGLVAQLPLALPPVVSGLLLVNLFGPYGLLGAPLTALGLGPVGTLGGLVIAQTFVSSPFVVIAARSAFESVSPALEGVAETLGASPWRIFFSVSVPPAIPALLAGALLAWLRAFGEFGATVIMAYHPYGLPVLAWVLFDGYGLGAVLPVIGASLALALVVLFLSFIASRTPRFPAPAVTEAPVALPALPKRPLPTLTLSQPLRRRHGRFNLDLNLQVSAPRIALLGPSGAGKSLTLRAIAGLDGPFALQLEPTRSPGRSVGYVPQDAGLFPHLSVRDNIAFGLPGEERDDAVDRWLAAVDLKDQAYFHPAVLSGGQRQRCALARALAPLPSLLLLDEPLSGVDVPERRRLRQLISTAQEAAGAALVIVTHDPQEALLLSDAAVLIARGKVIAQGRTRDLFNLPPTPEAALFLGKENVLWGEGKAGYLCLDGLPLIPLKETGRVPFWVPPPGILAVSDGEAGLALSSPLSPAAPGEWSAKTPGGQTLTGLGEAPPRRVRIDPEMIRLFPERGGGGGTV